MRKFFVSVAVFAFGPAAAIAIAFTPPGPISFQIDAITQATEFHTVTGKTNETATSTNIMTVSSATVATAPFTSSNLVALLTNSFNTNFPAGAKIGISFGSLVVLDSTGAVIFNPSPVLTTTFNEQMFSIKQTQVESITQTNTSFSGSSAETITIDFTINYDDTAASPGDTIHSTFQLRGVLVEKINRNIKTNFEKINYQFQGSGGGSIHGVPTILDGTFKANAAGAPPPV